MTVIEHALQWDCAGSGLVGVLSTPCNDAGSDLGLLIVVGGPQVRVGSHRQFVHTARAAGTAGYPALRFDVRGMGDAEGDPRGFDALDDDIDSAITAMLASQPHLRGVVLCGLCDGASAIAIYLAGRQDQRVKGLCLINPWVRSSQSQAKTRVDHYYRRRLTQAAFWRKLLTGQVAARALRDLLAAIRQSRQVSAKGTGEFQDRMLQGLQGFAGPCLLVLSAEDYTAKEFLTYCEARREWQDLLARPTFTRCELPGADHTLSNGDSQARFEVQLLKWLAIAAGAPR